MPGQHRQLGKEGVDAAVAFCPDAAAVRLRDGLRDGKAEAKAAVARPRGVCAGKSGQRSAAAPAGESASPSFETDRRQRFFPQRDRRTATVPPEAYFRALSR